MLHVHACLWGNVLMSMTAIFVAGTFLWMLAADTYADYDGYTVYTTKRASKAPQPKWSDLTADYMLGVSCAMFTTHTEESCCRACDTVCHACWLLCCCDV